MFFPAIVAESHIKLNCLFDVPLGKKTSTSNLLELANPFDEITDVKESLKELHNKVDRALGRLGIG